MSAEAQRAYKARHPERVKETERKYRAGKGRSTRNAALAGWKRRNPERAYAHHAVWRAVRSGRLIKQPCSVCGSEPTQGHHHNGYAPEHRLDVVWLCQMHHTAAHAESAA